MPGNPSGEPLASGHSPHGLRRRHPLGEFGRLASIAPLVLLLLGLAMVTMAADSTSPAEEPSQGKRSEPVARLKSAIVIESARFFIWPGSVLGDTNQPFRIGILGTDPFGDAMKLGAQSKTALGHRITLVRSRRPEDLKSCHLVFISPDRQISLKDSLAPFAGLPILLVGDEPDFARRGGMVNLRLRGELVAVEICKEAVESTGLGFKASLRQTKRIEWITNAVPP